MFYAGIDWADDHHDVVVIDETGNRKGSLRVAHTKVGLSELNSFLARFTSTTATANDPNHIACIIETNGSVAKICSRAHQIHHARNFKGLFQIIH